METREITAVGGLWQLDGSEETAECRHNVIRWKEIGGEFRQTTVTTRKSGKDQFSFIVQRGRFDTKRRLFG